MNKLLALLQILIKETDENHKLTTNQLIEKLSEQGVYAHRNTIHSDIEKLRNAGYDIICDKSTQNKYFMGSRGMELSEIKMLLVDFGAHGKSSHTGGRAMWGGGQDAR